jgi:hypothetical protein
MAGQFMPGHLSFSESLELVGTSRHEFPLSARTGRATICPSLNDYDPSALREFGVAALAEEAALRLERD